MQVAISELTLRTIKDFIYLPSYLVGIKLRLRARHVVIYNVNVAMWG